MSQKKTHLVVLCGGASCEHNVSLRSATNICNKINQSLYQLSVIYITKAGQWYKIHSAHDFITHGPEYCIQKGLALRVLLQPGIGEAIWVSLQGEAIMPAVDCVFPVLHGTQGEDGCIQGLLEMLSVPYIGSGVLGSSLCFAKHVAKQLWRSNDLPTCDWITICRQDQQHIDYQELALTLGAVLFVKPSGQGSSIGVSKVSDQESLTKAITHAFLYDDYVIIESAIEGREIECSVIGNHHLDSSLPGEVVVNADFYDYAAKYEDECASRLVVPADLSLKQQEQVQALAMKAYQALGCQGLARVDFFVNEQSIYLNEINTLPGFTDTSMFAINWEQSGLSFDQLIAQLVQYAKERYQQQQSAQHHVEAHHSVVN